ncbi:MAG TPA: hypothetical protein DEP01_08040 [Aminobacterium sp.]|jgi:rRNA-processing protein FCF1|uniref:hypothetical protein n=1 Tax=Aminobacterium TaxID=81466 RepID=UPI000EC2F701|nr:MULTISPECIES: hypothetical protein [unclassified Aminobacterium]HCA41422.1 hypothetical protein [Aminobacterium sp.]
MKPKIKSLRLLILDACVLIDFLKVEPSLLVDISQCIGSLHVVSFVLDEVPLIASDEEAARLGLKVINPEVDDIYGALDKSGRTSFQDELCCLTAKRQGFVCVTNDKALRRRCKEEGVSVLRGLRLLIELYRAGGIGKRKVLQIAENIKENNPYHITREIMKDFEEEIEDI